jgi:hypothetical protein
LLSKYLADNDANNFSGSKGSGGVYSDTYTYLLSATASIINEGERSVVSYAY